MNKTFNFTPTTDADNVTSVEVRFYGWNGGDPFGTMLFDNVSTGIAVVPESSTVAIALLPMALIGLRAVRRRGISRRG